MEKHKFASISLTLQDRGISLKFLISRVSRVYGRLFTKIAFPPLLAAILNFCVKRKSSLISETLQDRAISTKFWNCRVSAESTGVFFAKNCFPATFGSHLEFLRKAQKHIYLGNGARNFEPTGYLQSVLVTFCKNHFPAVFWWPS